MKELNQIINIVFDYIAYCFWLCYFTVLALPALIPLIVEREYLYLKIMLTDLFTSDDED